MQLKRKQTLRAGAGLLTALTLSVGALAGCTPAKFNLGGGSPTQTSPVGTQSKPMTFQTLSGQAMVNGKPLANANIKVFNALTDKAASVIAMGGGNVIAAGGGNVLAIGGGNLKTDAQGNFSIQIGNLQSGSVARVVATGGGATVTNLVSGSGKSLSKAYKVAQAGGISIKLNERTTLATILTERQVDKVRNLVDQVRGGIVDMVMGQASDAADKADNYADSHQAEFAQFLASLDPETGSPRNQETVNNLSKDAGISDEFESLSHETDTSVAQASADKNNVVQGNEDSGDQPSTGDQPGTNEPGTQQPGTTDQPSTPTTTDSNSDSQGDDGDTLMTFPASFNSSSSFNPTIVLTYTTGTLNIGVTQFAGQDDIDQVIARIPHVAGTTLNLANLVPGTGGTTTIAGNPGPAISLTQSATAAGDEGLPLQMGGDTLSGALWTGYLNVGATHVATFQVFDHDGDYYLVTDYILDDASVFSGGSVSSLHTTAVTALAPSTKADIALTSRHGSLALRQVALN
jgi:hypothetical protein